MWECATYGLFILYDSCVYSPKTVCRFARAIAIRTSDWMHNHCGYTPHGVCLSSMIAVFILQKQWVAIAIRTSDSMHDHCEYVIFILITTYLLLRVNLDKIMHACWDFDASSARNRRVSALDKHQNWSASALFCLNSRAQSKYAVVNLIHTRRKQTFLSFICENTTF